MKRLFELRKNLYILLVLTEFKHFCFISSVSVFYNHLSKCWYSRSNAAWQQTFYTQNGNVGSKTLNVLEMFMLQENLLSGHVRPAHLPQNPREEVGVRWRNVLTTCCSGETLLLLWCSARSLSGHLVPLFSRVFRGAQAAGRGSRRGGEAGKGLLWLPSAPHPPSGEEGAGGRCPAGHRCVLLAVCADGVRWREARIHSSDGGASWNRSVHAQLMHVGYRLASLIT